MTDQSTCTAVLLAAGFATRLYPLTRDRAKPLLDVGGKPVLTHLLERVLRLDGIGEIVVISNARFAEQFRSWASESRSPVPISVIDDGALDVETRRGGIGDLRLAMDHAKTDSNEWFVVAGDNLFGCELTPYQTEFRRCGGGMVVARDLGADVPPGRFGEITVDGDGRITRFREKPEVPESPLAATCTYFFPADVATDVASYLETGGDPDAPGNFIAWLSARRAVYATPLQGDYHDIGNHETLAQARAAFEQRD